MKQNAKGTIFRTVIDYFYEAEEATKEQVKADLAGDIDVRQIGRAISFMLTDGRLIRDGEVMRLSRAVRHAMNAEREVKTELVPAPARNVFGPAMSAKHYLPRTSMRPGADDFRQWESKHV